MSLSSKRPSSNIKAKLMQDVLDASEEPQKRLNVKVDAGFYKKIKMQSVSEDRTISEITKQLWQQYLEKAEK